MTPGDGGSNGGQTDGGSNGGQTDGGSNGGQTDGGSTGGQTDGGSTGGQTDGGSTGGPTDGGSDGGVMTTRLTIQGRVIDAPNAQAEIVATVGSESYGATADSAGRFSLDIVRPRTAPTNSWVTLTARNTGSHPVVLKAVLGEIGQLATTAGADGVLTRQEHNNAYLTHLTTAHYVLLTQANGGAPPVTNTDTRAAEKEVDAGRLLEMATVLKLVTNDPVRYPLPAGTASTLALVQDLAAYRRFVTQHAAAVEAAQPQLLADLDILAHFFSAQVPSAYYAVIGIREGFLPRTGDKLVLRSAGSGEYLDLKGQHPFSWNVISGALVLNFSPPLTEVTYPETNRCPNQSQIESTFTINQHRYKLLADGAYVEQAQLSRSGTRSYAPCSDGSQIPSSAEVDESTISLRNADRLPSLSLTGAQFAGTTWGIDQYLPYGDPPAVELMTDLVTFAGNATGSSRRSGANFTWQITDGKLVMTYADGSKQRVEWLESLPPVEGVFSERTDATGRVVSARYGGALPRRNAAAFTSQLLTTSSGTYWQSGVNTWQSAVWTGDELEWERYFGWELRATFSADRLDFISEPASDDGDSVPNEKFVQRTPQTWTQVDAQTVRVDSTQQCNGSPCRRRYWYLMDVSPTNQRFYLVEEIFYRFNFSPPGEFIELGAPRWNFYDRRPVPPADVYGP